MFKRFKKLKGSKARYAEIEAELDALAVRMEDLGIIIASCNLNKRALALVDDMQRSILKRERELIDELVALAKSA